VLISTTFTKRARALVEPLVVPAAAVVVTRQVV